MNKSALRKKYLDQRLALSDGAYTQYNQQVIDLFFASVSLSEVKHLHLFLPIAKFKEINTWEIIERIRRKYSYIKFVIPKVIGNQLEHYIYEGKEQLAIDKWGIPEPKYGKIISPKQIDLVLVPLVVADQQGNRVGYGKGYYDRFLIDCKQDTQKIGLSLFPLADEHIDNEETDIRLDACVTPASFVQFG